MESRGRLNNLDRWPTLKYWHTQTVFSLGTKTSTNEKPRNYSINLKVIGSTIIKPAKLPQEWFVIDLKLMMRELSLMTSPLDMPQISTGRIKVSLPGFIPTNIKYVFSIKMYIQSAKT